MRKQGKEDGKGSCEYGSVSIEIPTHSYEHSLNILQVSCYHSVELLWVFCYTHYIGNCAQFLAPFQRLIFYIFCKHLVWCEGWKSEFSATLIFHNLLTVAWKVQYSIQIETELIIVKGLIKLLSSAFEACVWCVTIDFWSLASSHVKIFLHWGMHCSCCVLPNFHLLEDLSSQSFTTAYAMYLNPHSTSGGSHVLVIRYSLYMELYIQFII